MRWTDESLNILKKSVEAERFIIDQAELKSYRDPYWPLDDNTYYFSAVVLPKDTEELREVLKIANQYNGPVWTASLGKNWGYGGTSSIEPGSVLILLNKMNSVIEINRDLAYAVVEPGVSWIQLHEELSKQGIDDLLISVPEIGWGSIVGNTLDSGVTFLPYGRDFRSMRGLEVMLADGTLMRSGHGGIENSSTWPIYSRAGAPPLQDIFIQSNFGIVTKMSVALMPKPSRISSVYLSVDSTENLARGIDAMRQLCLQGIIEGVPTLNNLMALRVQRPQLIEKIPEVDFLEPGELRRIGEETGLGSWGFRLGLWGDETKVENSIQIIKAKWEGIGRFSLLDKSDDIGEMYVHKLHQGEPNTDIVENLNPKYGQFSFTPVIPLIGSNITDAIDVLEEYMRNKLQSNLSVSGFIINERSMILTANIKTHLQDSVQFSKARTALKELIELFGSRGIGSYRTHIDVMQVASEQFSFEDHSHAKVLNRIKAALDTNHILSPGRYGVR